MPMVTVLEKELAVRLLRSSSNFPTGYAMKSIDVLKQYKFYWSNVNIITVRLGRLMLNSYFIAVGKVNNIWIGYFYSINVEKL